ncbi:MAG: hypothetical protein A2083_06785 [Gemmatimonadetes bacterium GWC2_71_9]|nr:MAG: hypothetical protein A2083_06785 [Gemmatimonadetes bacterium GWC2_71_9]
MFSGVETGVNHTERNKIVNREQYKLSLLGGATSMAIPTSALRAPTSGDRLVPLGGAGRRKVARLLMEAQVPRGDRARWPVIVRGGEPLWIPGVCRGAAAVPEPGTQSVRVDVGDG